MTGPQPGALRVFISHADEDAALCQPLVSMLDAWQVACWCETREPGAEQLSQRAQESLSTCRLFLRVCTRDTRYSYWMSLETGAFLSLQIEDFRAGRPRRPIVNLVLDEGYAREPFDSATLTIDAAKRPVAAWIPELRQALGLPPLVEVPAVHFPRKRQQRGITRRQTLGLGVAVAGLAVVGVAGAAVLERRGGTPPRTNRPDPREVWRFKTGSPASGEVVIANDMVYVAAGDQLIYALDAATGKPRWTFRTLDAHVLPLMVVGNSVYFSGQAQIGPDPGNDNNGFVALDAATGTITGSDIADKVQTSAVISPPLVSGGVVYYGTSPQPPPATFVAHDASSGTRLWTNITAGGVRARAATGGDMVYFGSLDNAVHALDAATGRTRWRYFTGDQIVSTPAVVDGVVYAGSDDMYLYALDATGGTLRWRLQTGGVVSSPAVVDGAVYIGSGDGAVYAVDTASGRQLWRYATSAPILSSPAVANGVVYIGSNDSYVYALDAASGTLVRRYAAGGPVISTPAVAGGIVIVGSYDSYIHAFTA